MVLTITDSLIRMYRPFKENERKLAMFAMITLHVQLLIGIALYFVSPTIEGFMDAGHIMKNPVEIALEMSKPAEGVIQAIYMLSDHQKLPLINSLIADNPEYQSILIFSSTKLLL
jgi:hypothetical protein